MAKTKWSDSERAEHARTLIYLAELSSMRRLDCWDEAEKAALKAGALALCHDEPALQPEYSLIATTTLNALRKVSWNWCQACADKLIEAMFEEIEKQQPTSPPQEPSAPS